MALYLKKYWTPPRGLHLDRIYNGEQYDSGFEAWCAEQLDEMVRSEQIKSWTRQVRTECRMYGELVTTYKWDFVLKTNDDRLIYVESKGYFYEKDKPRFKLATIQVHEDHVDCEVWLVMQNAQKPRKSLRFKKQGIDRVKMRVLR